MTDHKVPTPTPGSNVRFIAWAGYRCAFLRKKTAGTTSVTASRAPHRISGLGTVLGSLLSVALSPGQAIKSTTTASGRSKPASKSTSAPRVRDASKRAKTARQKQHYSQSPSRNYNRDYPRKMAKIDHKRPPGRRPQNPTPRLLNPMNPLPL